MSVINPAHDLTESQKTCLRLVARGLTSKEIALETGWSYQTVDKYVTSAIARLKADNRRHASRLLLEAEAGPQLSQQLGSQLQPLAEQPAMVEADRAAPDGRRTRVLVPPPLGGSLNQLTALERTLAVLKVAALSAAALVALTLLIAGVLQTFR